MIVFDVETAPLPDEQLFANVAPFVAPKPPGEFDPASVKYGNVKDEAKRQQKLDDCRKQHDLDVQNYLADVAAKRIAWADKIRNEAALDPTTGYVLAIGYLGINDATGQRKVAIDHGPEPLLLKNFWARWQQCFKDGRKLIGHNIWDFDFPFIIRRSWILRVEIPSSIFDYERARSLAIDTRRRWMFGQRSGDCESSLRHVSQALGVGEKNGNGADFAKLWLSGDETDRQVALSYLTNDLNLTAGVAERMGVL